MRNWRIINLGFLIVLLVSSFACLPVGTALALAPPPEIAAQAKPDIPAVELSWKPVTNAVGFNVYRKEHTDPAFRRLNSAAITTLNFTDRNVVRGKDYLYMVRTIDSGGLESADSIGVGAPLVTMLTSAKVVTTKDKPTALRSIKTGKLVSFATTGDMITYQIAYANQGFSSAKEIRIDYAIPNGTVLAGPPRVIKGAQAEVVYFDRRKKSWQDQLENEENIEKVRFLIPGQVPPVLNRKDLSGIIVLNVIINI